MDVKNLALRYVKIKIIRYATAVVEINDKAPEKCALYAIKIEGMMGYPTCIFYKSLKYKEYRKRAIQFYNFLPKYYIKYMYDYMKNDFKTQI